MLCTVTETMKLADVVQVAKITRSDCTASVNLSRALPPSLCAGSMISFNYLGLSFGGNAYNNFKQWLLDLDSFEDPHNLPATDDA